MRGGRLVFLALDAADVDLIQHWAKKAELKALAGIVTSSKMVRLVNEPGLYVGSLWPTISMGTSVASHGRYCWRQLRAGEYEDEFFQVDQIRGEPIWEKLDKLGKSICVIDIPKSTPGIMFRGRFVKDWGTHDPSTGGFRIYGWMKAAEFVRRYGRDEVGRCDAIDRTAAGFGQFRDRLVARAAARARMVCDVLSEGTYEVIMASFSESHCVGHQCWHLHDPGHELHDQMLRHELGDPVLSVYRALDEAVGNIFEHLSQFDTVMLLATHGMGRPYKAVELLNSIVADLEFESLNANDQDALRTSGVPHLLSYDSADFRRLLRVFPVPNNGAYAAFRLNIKGREPEGRLAPEDAERFLREFHDHVMSMANADTGEKLFVSAVFRRASYSGPLSEDLPDLLLEWNRSSPIKRVVTPRSILWNSNGADPRTGDHRAPGGMWVTGPGAELFESVESIRTSEVSAWMIPMCERFGGAGANIATRLQT
jgi:predicted AlkP superfamily phosphohydrolase/phosphomutase